jgi:type I site-specific restriction-modification system R (restriction) subunit
VQISVALYKLRTEAGNHSRDLYGNNQAVYTLLRYGAIGTPEKYFLTWKETETDKEFVYNTYTELLQDVDARSGMTRTETYEEWAKALFVKEPANMKLLIVVDKLLTGFDAPPYTYLYIDKSMQDHGLFQSICRTNRLDGED